MKVEDIKNENTVAPSPFSNNLNKKKEVEKVKIELNENKSEDNDNMELISPESDNDSNKTIPKKRVSWAPPEKLVEERLFVSDDYDINRVKIGDEDMRKQEMRLEKQLMKKYFSFNFSVQLHKDDDDQDVVITTNIQNFYNPSEIKTKIDDIIKEYLSKPNEFEIENKRCSDKLPVSGGQDKYNINI